MIPAAFDYVAPTSVADAVSAISAAGEDGKILAGGQSLIPVLRLRMAYPSTVVDLGRISAVNAIFIGSSNELGAFESGFTAKLLGTVPAVVLGGLASLGVVGIVSRKIPELRDLKRLE